MSVLPLPYKLLIASGITAGLLGFGWVKGIEHAEEKNAAYLAEQSKKALESERVAREQERLLQGKKDAALAAAKKRADALRDAVAAVTNERDGLRDDLAAARLQLPNASCDTVRKRTATLTDVFEQCVKRYSEVAGNADGHATDSLTLQESWPQAGQFRP